MPAPFYLVGPTATGKSSLAIAIALRTGAEIVSADAFQIYRGLDVLTAKPTPAQLDQVPHHLLSILPLTEEYSVARFAAAASSMLAEIASRGKRALVVGGSGLYIKALTHGLSPLPSADPALRARLEAADLDLLNARLGSLDPEAPLAVDTRNKRRVIRAIEICEGTGAPLAAARTSWQGSQPYQRGLFLTRSRAALHTRIDARIDGMVSAGVLEEVAAEHGTRFSATSSKILGLGGFQAYLRGQITLPACLADLKAATRKYAKRQETWFRGAGGFNPFNVEGLTEENIITEAVRRWEV